MWGFSAFYEGSLWLNLDYVNLSTLFCPCWCEALIQHIFLTSPNHKQLKVSEHSNFAHSFCQSLTYFPENFKWFEAVFSVLSMFWWVRFFLCHPVESISHAFQSLATLEHVYTNRDEAEESNYWILPVFFSLYKNDPWKP